MSIPGDTVRSRIPLFRKTTAATTTRAPARKQLLQRNKIFSNSANRRPNPLSRIRQRILADQRRKKQKPKAAVATAGITHLAKVEPHGVICFVQTVSSGNRLLLAETTLSCRLQPLGLLLGLVMEFPPLFFFTKPLVFSFSHPWLLFSPWFSTFTPLGNYPALGL